MNAEEAPTTTRRPLRDIITGGPAKTFLAASVLGLMWGPILASVLDAVGRVSEHKTAQVETDLRVSLPSMRPDSHADLIVTEVTAIPMGTSSDDSAIERLKGLTRQGSLSNLDDPANTTP
ncbi:hypothetical protein SAMN05444004_102234 [Jannaschia faecimaris]|uniref:Uncharacterized protein n=1 Tax=Jannaschia faecimaris TaxID=1244108 RepID=A0A1H3LL23_9RHOB|nr:hypothetical protein [Jannaschia faecimaris]SDY64839.1 hypothetical protein SAMN05444004_102234 [Jannaschia faecimaris]